MKNPKKIDSLSEANQQIHVLRAENQLLRSEIEMLKRTIAEETSARYDAYKKLGNRLSNNV